MRVALFTGVLLCLGGAATAAALLTTTSSSRPANRLAAVKSEPGEFTQEKPGQGEKSIMGQAEQSLLLHAYPAKDVPLAWTNKARASWSAIVTKTERASVKKNAAPPARTTKRVNAPNLSGTPNVWQSIGPTNQSVFPTTLSYSGARYPTSGRVTAMAILPGCTGGGCTLLVGAAGGGIWRTTNALATPPTWTWVSGNFDTNAIGSIYVDPNNPLVVYVGTGEPNASGDSESGTGLYKSTDGGQTFGKVAAIQAAASASCGSPDLTPCVPGASPFLGRSIGSIAIESGNSNHIVVTTDRGVRGIASTTSSGVSLNSNFPPIGGWESTDGGATWSYAWNANLSVRGATHVEFDRTPGRLTDVYMSAFNVGLWARRPSQAEGGSFVQIYPANNPADNTDRTEFALTNKGGFTRIYVYEGTAGPGSGGFSSTASAFWRIDNANQPAATLAGSKAAGATPPAIGAADYPHFFNGWQRLTMIHDVANPQNDFLSPYFSTYNNCTGQCWYDNFVVTPPGRPDDVYIGGSYMYAEFPCITRGILCNFNSAGGAGVSNARGVVFSNTGGDPDTAFNRRTFTDMTMDIDFGQDDTCSSPLAPTPNSPPNLPPSGVAASCWIAPNAMHPDQHALVIDPNNPAIFFDGSDGGVVRNDGQFQNFAQSCNYRGFPSTALGAAQFTTCTRLNSSIPNRLISMNYGLVTLQYQSFSINPRNPQDILGGTQDNGTFRSEAQPQGQPGSTDTWTEIIDGDGGQSGFDVGNNSHLFNEFSGQAGGVNYDGGVESEAHWFYDTGPMFNSADTSLFYWPQIPDPRVAGTIFMGQQHVWRTKDWAGQAQTTNPANNCDVLTAPDIFAPCGDYVPMGTSLPVTTPNSAGGLTGTFYGGTRTTGNVTQDERTKADTSTMWAGTSAGRLFITQNADCGTATDASCVTYTRLDTLAANSPGRYVSGIYVNPTNPLQAWVSYGGYNQATPSQPGHVFRVDYNPGGGTATWTDLNVEAGLGAYPNTGGGDLPITDVVRDDRNGDLYASTDFGVLRDAGGVAGAWSVAGTGLPMVEVPELTLILPDPLGQEACTGNSQTPCIPALYAATHGRSGWAMRLP